MSILPSQLAAVLPDRTGLVGAIAGVLADLPPTLIASYLLLKVLLPPALIVYAVRGATPTQRIGLIWAYLVPARRLARPRRGNS